MISKLSAYWVWFIGIFIPVVIVTFWAGRVQRKPFLHSCIALSRALLIFVFWWGGRFLAEQMSLSGFWYWAATVVIFFVSLAIFNAVLGNVAAQDYSSSRVAAEMFGLVFALLLLILLGIHFASL